MKLVVEDLRVCFKGREILKGINAEFTGGEVIGLIGCNAGGKTTLLKAAAGLIPSTGRVSLSEGGPRDILYVPQLSSVESSLTAFEMVLLGLHSGLSIRIPREKLAKVDAALEELGISSIASKPLSSLSGGQRQLVFMAQAFVNSPKVLLLDEPTSALDLKHQWIVMNEARRYAKEKNAVVVAVVHDLGLASRFADKLMLLEDGRVRSFDAPDIVLNPHALSEVYKVLVAIEKTPKGYLSIIPENVLED